MSMGGGLYVLVSALVPAHIAMLGYRPSYLLPSSAAQLLTKFWSARLPRQQQWDASWVLLPHQPIDPAQHSNLPTFRALLPPTTTTTTTTDNENDNNNNDNVNDSPPIVGLSFLVIPFSWFALTTWAAGRPTSTRTTQAASLQSHLDAFTIPNNKHALR